MHERDIFIEALQKTDPAERAEFVAAACAGDANLQRRVERLFEEHERAESFILDSPAPLAAASAAPPAEERIGAQIGPYKLLRQIGEGGMGIVYLAEQGAPVRRTVALKLVRSGMDSRSILARFDAERHALALMDHPNIAKVYDAGVTDSGRPYFAMEPIDGETITAYCDARRLKPRQRLELFLPVCQAVQHAHQKGIIHRDLKPGNVLIAQYDGQPVPKVIDFGVAKATGPKLTELSLATDIGQVIGTPEYMSPEQAELNQLDVDTRSDVYSLGVLLYELLTGTTPLERKRLKQAAVLELLRLVREEDPPRPSIRLSTVDELPSIAANRGLEPARLSGTVRGDLDWIVMKALEKDRDRRYETASGLAADVENFLGNEPVAARPPSTWYRFCKFTRRNKVAVTAAALIATSLAAGVVASICLTIWALDAERLARERATEEAAQRKLAQESADEASAARQLAQTALADSEAHRERAERNFHKARDAVKQMIVRVADDRLLNLPQMDQVRRKLLEDAIRFHEGFLQEQGDDPAVRLEAGRAFGSMGDLYRLLRETDRAKTAYGQAVALFQRVVADDPASALAKSARWDLGASFNNLAVVLMDADQVEGGRTAFGQALQTFQSLARDYPDVPKYRQEVAGAQLNLALLLDRMGRPVEAARECRLAVQVFEGLAADYPKKDQRADLLYAYSALGNLLNDSDPPEAERARRKCVDITERLVADDPAKVVYREWLAGSYNNLGGTLFETERFGEAEEIYRKGLPIQSKLAADHPDRPSQRSDLANLLNNLGEAQYNAGRHAEARAPWRDAIAILKELVAQHATDGDFRQFLANSYENLAMATPRGAGHEGPEQLYSQALDLRRALAAELPQRPDYRHDLAALHEKLGAIYASAGQADAAGKSWRQALEIRASLVNEFADEPNYASSLARLLADCPAVELRDPPRALSLAKKAVDLSPSRGAWNALGIAHYRTGDWRQAVEALQQAASPGVARRDDFFFLAMAHGRLGEREQARQWFDRAVAWRDQRRPNDPELERLRAEAAELLGIESPPPSTP